ncbi:phospholipase A and acyltransferase 4-like [Pseudoliparis swirei]|uniref:phospholipase A and acyltransferase 4-like n=1 Tax=Pseudoliparis swirei TaxID=2059687 RepID=UPI0024BDFE4F|nr:phospholipase A and acyltransferase 4-like [Pseudoliparis swirei]
MDPTQFEHGAKPGDLIEIFRGSFEHWAVYIGGNEVVHFTGGDSGSLGNTLLALTASVAQVMRDKIWEVIHGDRFQINNLLDDKYEPRERHVIVREACRMVGSVLKYSVVSLNCEHFATKLRYGRPESRQRRFLEVLAGPLLPSRHLHLARGSSSPVGWRTTVYRSAAICPLILCTSR